MPRGRVKFVDRDRGWGRLRRELRKSLRHPHVAVGIFGEKGSEPHQDSNFTNAQVGSVHEFGLGNVPERSFIRGTIDQKGRKITRVAKALATQVLQGQVSTKIALDILGQFVKGEIQKRIARGIPPPLKPATIARKGSSKPLIDKGQLRASIDHEVRRV